MLSFSVEKNTSTLARQLTSHAQHFEHLREENVRLAQQRNNLCHGITAFSQQPEPPRNRLQPTADGGDPAQTCDSLHRDIGGISEVPSRSPGEGESKGVNPEENPQGMGRRSQKSPSTHLLQPTPLFLYQALFQQPQQRHHHNHQQRPIALPLNSD